MLPFTLDDHFSYGYGDGVFNPQDKAPGNFWCKYSRCTREPLSFKAECIETAKLIYEHAELQKRNVVLFLSGGLDSEVMVKAFIAAEVPFKTITFKYSEDLNSHEISYVEAFVAKNNLQSVHTFFDIDFPAWINSDDVPRLFTESYASDSGTLPHLALMDHVWRTGGLPVLGNGDVYLEKIEGKWMYVELEYMLGWFRYAVTKRIHGAIGFFQFTPEITLAMLREPKIERLGNGQDKLANSVHSTSRYIKYQVYLKHWPELAMRQKFHGAEKVGRFFSALDSRLLHALPERYNDRFILSYAEFKEMLEPQT